MFDKEKEFIFWGIKFLLPQISENGCCLTFWVYYSLRSVALTLFLASVNPDIPQRVTSSPDFCPSTPSLISFIYRLSWLVSMETYRNPQGEGGFLDVREFLFFLSPSIVFQDVFRCSIRINSIQLNLIRQSLQSIKDNCEMSFDSIKLQIIEALIPTDSKFLFIYIYFILIDMFKIYTIIFFNEIYINIIMLKC